MLLKTVQSGKVDPTQLNTRIFKLDQMLEAYDVFGRAAGDRCAQSNHCDLTETPVNFLPSRPLLVCRGFQAMKIPFEWTLFLALVLPGISSAALPALSEYQTALHAAPDFDHGAVLFAQCAACHGDEGQGLSDGTTPRIAGQHFHVLVKQLVDFRRGKRWDFRMEQRAKSHISGFQDIADVAFYLSAQPRKSDGSTSSGETLAMGANLYASNCSSCHGKQGEGDDVEAVPMLAGQHPAYLLRQMYDAVDGRRPTLARLHSQRIKPLGFEQLHAVADFVSQLGAGN